jgi:dienelactone hydrolase
MLSFAFLLACSGLTVCAAAPLSASPSLAILPRPTGPCQVGRSVAEVIDTSRTQPYVGDTGPRKLMISVFYPVNPEHPSAIIPYMPPDTALAEDITLSALGLPAPNGTFERVAFHLATSEPINHTTPSSFPLIIFMPAEGTTRLFYSQICSTIASNGYTVVSIDSPNDVDIIEYTDGSTALINLTLWNNPNLTELALPVYLDVANRVADVSFVLDNLSNATFAHTLIPNLSDHGLNTSHTAMFGHSLGGTTAFSILGSDDRVKGGIDMDGSLVGPPLVNGTKKPFMFVGHENHTRANGDGDLHTWAPAWQNLTGWKREITVVGAGHYDFSDYPLLFETLDIIVSDEAAQAGILTGSLDGVRALQIVTTYVGAFLDLVIHGKESFILNGPVGEFPEVLFEF